MKSSALFAAIGSFMAGAFVGLLRNAHCDKATPATRFTHRRPPASASAPAAPQSAAP